MRYGTLVFCKLFRFGRSLDQTCMSGWPGWPGRQQGGWRAAHSLWRAAGGWFGVLGRRLGAWAGDWPGSHLAGGQDWEGHVFLDTCDTLSTSCILYKSFLGGLPLKLHTILIDWIVMRLTINDEQYCQIFNPY